MVVSFTVFSYLFVDINLIYLKTIYTGVAITQRYLIASVYAIFILCFSSFYVYFLFQIKRKNITFLSLKILILISSIMLLSYPAILSFDIFNYMSTAKVTCFYQENPYIIMPIEFTNDPTLLYTRAANKTALYGPVWIAATCIPFVLGLSSFLLTVFLFKAIPAVFYFGLCYLIYKVSDKNLFSLSFFALNPLVLIETFVSGHNDSAMMFFALASMYFLSKRKIWIAFFLIFLSILIKFATVVLLPVFAYELYCRFRGKKIEWDSIWFRSGLLMFIIFLMSPIREEMYPWYAIWFITFISLVHKKSLWKIGTILFSFTLMLTYLPYMATGMYHGIVPIVRIILILIPLFLFFGVVSFLKIKKIKWDF